MCRFLGEMRGPKYFTCIGAAAMPNWQHCFSSGNCSVFKLKGHNASVNPLSLSNSFEQIAMTAGTVTNKALHVWIHVSAALSQPSWINSMTYVFWADLNGSSHFYSWISVSVQGLRIAHICIHHPALHWGLNCVIVPIHHWSTGLSDTSHCSS